MGRIERAFNYIFDMTLCRHYSADLSFFDGKGHGSVVVSEPMWMHPQEVHQKLIRQTPKNIAITNFRRL